MKTVLRVLLVLSLLVSLTGCWDDRPIDMRELVLVMGVAPGPHHQLTVLLEVPTPGALTSLVGSSGAASTGAASTFLLTGSGPSLGAAISAAQAQSDRDIYLGQVQMVFFSSHLSPAQFTSALDFFTRLGPFDKTAYAAVSKGSLQRTMSFHPAQSRVSALYFTTLFSCTRCQRIDLKRTVFTLEKRYKTPGASIWLPVVYPGPTDYIVDSLAVYDQNRVAMMLSPNESLALSYVLGTVTKGTLALQEPFGLVGVRAVHSTASTSTVLKGHRLELTVKLQVSGAIDTLAPGKASKSNLDRIEAGANRMIAQETLKELVLLQTKGLNPVAFGRRLLWYHPSLVSHWPTLYRHADITVHVRTHISDVGDVT